MKMYSVIPQTKRRNKERGKAILLLAHIFVCLQDVHCKQKNSTTQQH